MEAILSAAQRDPLTLTQAAMQVRSRAEGQSPTIQILRPFDPSLRLFGDLFQSSL